MSGLVAAAEADVEAPPARVWAVLTDLAQLKKLWFGADVTTDWRPGSPITWTGVWDGDPYEDRGEVLEVQAPRLLRFTHFSPRSGQPDRPESYHTLTFTLTGRGAGTHVRLTQDNNPDESAVQHSQGMWETLVSGLKEIAEHDEP